LITKKPVKNGIFKTLCDGSLKEKTDSQQHIKTMLKSVSNRNFLLACNAWLSCGQSSSPARTVFIWERCEPFIAERN